MILVAPLHLLSMIKSIVLVQIDQTKQTELQNNNLHHSLKTGQR